MQASDNGARVVYLSEQPPAPAGFLDGWPDLLDTDALSQLLGLCAATVRDLCRDGELPAVKLGGRWFVARRDLAALFEGERHA